MLISYRYGFIFIHIPRTSGISMRTALTPYAGGCTFPWLNPSRLRWEPDYPHYTAREVKEYLGHRQYSRYFKFAFVRNPWDRLLSRYFFLRGQESNDPQCRINQRRYYPPGSLSFTEWLLGQGEEKNCIHPLDLRQQVEWLFEPDGTPLVDFIGRFESLSTDFVEVCRRIGIEATLACENRYKPADDYHGYYSPEAEAFVAERFHGDIERWGYNFTEPRRGRDPDLIDRAPLSASIRS
jgi:hypothetical protein